MKMAMFCLCTWDSIKLTSAKTLDFQEASCFQCALGISPCFKATSVKQVFSDKQWIINSHYKLKIIRNRLAYQYN